MMAVWMGLYHFKGESLWVPLQLPAILILGPDAVTIGGGSKALIIGLLVHEAIAVFWGVVFAHMTGTNRVSALLGVGLAWGLFSWVFIQNLFSQSVREIFVFHFPAGLAIFGCLAYGLSLSSVAFFDRLLRKSA